MGKLDGKVAIVTGAGVGMGRAEAILFAKEGAKVVVDDRRTDGEGERTVQMIKEAGGEVVFVHADISKAEDVKKMVKTAVDTYGKLDILINNAGVQVYKPIQELNEENFDFIIATNQKGVFFGMKHALPEMIKAGGGSIVNTASIAADHAQRGSGVYAASKGGILSISRVAAAEFAPQNIRVNVVKPGAIKTPMFLSCVNTEEARKNITDETPQGRLGEPEEVANLVLFLASDEASHVTGQKIAADGGIETWSHII